MKFTNQNYSQIVSNLVTFYKLEELIGFEIVALTNMKASKFKGVESEAHILCAFNDNKGEPLKVPAGSTIGDRIYIEGFKNTEADVPQLNPKKKVWDKIQAELKTNSDGEVVWRDFNMLTISGDRITSSFNNSNIK